MSCLITALTAPCDTVPVTLTHDQSGLFTNDAWLRAHARSFAEREFGTLKAERFVLWLCHQSEDEQRRIAHDGYRTAAARYRIEIPDCVETCLPTD